MVGWILKLVKCYQAADTFLNTSYDDAGPSMINQSIMCGTPVICYDNGAALDVIEEGVSGFKVPTGHIEELSNKILKLYNYSIIEKTKLSTSSRQLAMTHNASNIFVENINSIIHDMRKNQI